MTSKASSPEKKKQLSGRRLLFVKALLADPCRNASAAYVAAGYTAKSSTVAASAAHKLLISADIQKAIEEHDRKIAKKYEVKAEKVLSRLMTGVAFDIRKLYHLEGEKEGKLKLPHELDDEAAAAVVGTRYSKDGVFQGYQIIDVKGCSELIGNHLGLFRQKVELTGADGGPVQFSDLDRANRIARLLKVAKARKGEKK